MKNELSSRQVILRQLWNSSGPREVWEILAHESEARGIDIVAELRSESDSCALVNPDLAKHLHRIAEQVERVHESINRFVAINEMSDLLALHRDFPFCWLRHFNRLLGTFWIDALKSGNTARIDAFRRALRLLRDVYVAVHWLQRGPQLGMDSWTKRIRENPMLCDPSFHAFLDERARFAAKNGDPSAESVAQMASYMRHCCKVVATITQLQDDRIGGEHVRIRLPLPPDWAELWFLVSEEFSRAMNAIAEQVNRGTQTLESAVRDAVRMGPQDEKNSVLQNEEDSESRNTLYASAFLEHLLRLAKPSVIHQAIDGYRDLAHTGHWTSPESRSTFVLRYTKALLNHWRYLPDPLIRLQDAVGLIDGALPSVDASVSPRLRRDLLFTRARLLENVGTWQPSAYESAAKDYADGLAVPSVKHELEARGRALTDYANTLRRLSNADEEENDRRILVTLEEALVAFNSDKSVIGRTLALNSYAIYLNERQHGEPAANQERALAMVEEAIELMERARQEEFAQDNDLVLRTLASLYMAKSNIIRKRESTDEYDANSAARNALRTALDRLGRSRDDQLRGIIYLNLGHVNLDRYAITGDAANARDAMYSYDEAKQLLQPYPHDFSHALFGSAMLIAEVPDGRTTEALEESVVAAQKALSLLEASNDAQALARGWFCFGELQFLRGRSGDCDAAINSFRISEAKFLEVGNYVNAVTSARRAAAVKVHQFRNGDSIDRVREAKELLLKATQWIDRLWQQIDSVAWRYTISDRFSNVYAEIAWCQATLNESIEALAFTVARAKGREFAAHIHEVQGSWQIREGLAEYLDQLRVESRLAETARWRAQRRAEPDRNVDETVRATQRKLEVIELQRRLLFPSPSDHNGESPIITLNAFLRNHPTALVCDITISRWGTVVILLGGTEAGKLAGLAVRVLPLDGATVLKWVQEWSKSYSIYLKSSGTNRDHARQEWADQTSTLLQDVGRNLMQPCLSTLDEKNLVTQLIIAAGRLAGVPLHAAPLDEGTCIAERVASAVYVPNIAVLSPEESSSAPPASALCVLSDPKLDLPLAAVECESVAKSLQQDRAKVTLLAAVGSAVGQKALQQRGINDLPGIAVLDDAPTPRRMSHHIPRCDHFFYSGHGTRRAGQSGLVLVDDKGNAALFSEEDILAMPALRQKPLIVLSACETGTGGQASAEMFDVASSFLRIGAQFVVASAWVVLDDCAKAFTAEFYATLCSNKSPSLAFGTALRSIKKNRSAVTSGGKVPADHPIYWAPFIAIRGE